MSTLRGQSVRIHGLKELQRDLRAVDKALPRELRKVNLKVAEEVASKARLRAHGVKGGERLARAIRASAQQRSAGVTITDAGRTAGALGFEFGAGQNSPRVRRSGSYVGYRQFDHWAGNGRDAGYAVYPTVRDMRSDMPDTYADALEPLLRKIGPVRGE